MSEKNDKIQAVKKYPDDVFLYCGKISREGYGLLSSAIESRIAEGKKADKACLILVTLGGDPHAAFRIARALRHHYSSLDILIPDLCKSAGTLICIAADRLIFGDRGEIGPLDVQIPKTDEFFESMSGLNLIQALNDLRDQMLESFRESFLYIRLGARLRTKQAAESAAELAKEFISPIVAQIDPVTLGEHQRALQITRDYGERLNKMSKALESDALGMLVEGYSDHEFVIDRKEARKLFKCVQKPDEVDSFFDSLYQWTRKFISRYTEKEKRKLFSVVDFKKELTEKLTQNENDRGHEESTETSLDEGRREHTPPPVENHRGKGSQN